MRQNNKIFTAVLLSNLHQRTQGDEIYSYPAALVRCDGYTSYCLHIYERLLASRLPRYQRNSDFFLALPNRRLELSFIRLQSPARDGYVAAPFSPVRKTQEEKTHVSRCMQHATPL